MGGLRHSSSGEPSNVGTRVPKRWLSSSPTCLATGGSLATLTEAEALEGDLSETLEERISAALGDPQFDPHGHPIPAKNGAMPKTSRRALWDVGDGEAALIEQVPDSHPDALRYLAEVGVFPRVMVTVVSRGPIGGPLFVRIKDDMETAPMALSKEVTEAIWVQ